MAEITCPYCGRVYEVPAFVSQQCECGAYWQADEDAGGNPTGEWEPPGEDEPTQGRS